MLSRRLLVVLSCLLSVAVAAVSCARGDYFWIAVSGFAMLVLAFPRMMRSEKVACSAIVAWTIVPYVLQLAFIATDMVIPAVSDGSIVFNGVPLFYYMSAFSISMQGFISGFAAIVVVNALGMVTLSRTWMLVFAMMVSLGVSAFCMFYAYGWMFFQGYPVTDPAYASLPEGRFMNGLMMVSPIVTVTSTIFFVLVGRVLVKGRAKESLAEDAA